MSILVRNSDGRRFKILWQARSPTGAIKIESVDSPKETIESRNDYVLREYKVSDK